MSCCEKSRVMLVGTGGYAGFYLETLEKPEFTQKAEFVCAVDPFCAPETKERLEKQGVRVFDDMQTAYDATGPIDLTLCVTPLPYHLEHIRMAVQNGSHVLCEKPAAPVMEQLEPMIRLEKESGKCVAIGFQWSFAPAMLACKQDILSGRYGKPLFAKALVLWPRPESYFKRGSGWGGKRFADDGSIINDSVASNATAHYLHNLYFMFGDLLSTSAMPEQLRMSVARANDIENYDTVCVEATLSNGARVLYLASHAVSETQNPLIEYRLENAVIRYDCETNRLAAFSYSGELLCDYGDVDGSVDTKVHTVLDAVRAGDWSGVPCMPSTAKAHVYTVDELFYKAHIHPFREEDKALYKADSKTERGVFVPGLAQACKKAYDNEQFLDFQKL